MKPFNEDDLELKVRKINTTNVAILDAMSAATKMIAMKNPMLKLCIDDIADICAYTIMLLELDSKER